MACLKSSMTTKEVFTARFCWPRCMTAAGEDGAGGCPEEDSIVMPGNGDIPF
jgi:hypothetical protein